MKILIALAFAALLAGCQSAPAMSNVRITLERGVCFGACPDYAVTITGDGQVTYHGRRFVRVTGEQHATASHADVAHLVSMLEGARFFELRDSYRGQVTDLPSYRVTYERGGRIKTVTDYAGEMAGRYASE